MQRRDSQRRGNKSIKVEARATDEAPEFDYGAAAPPICGHFRGEDELGLCRGLQSGDVIEIVVRAQFDDAFVEKGGAPLDDPLKEKLKEALAKIEALGAADDDGWVVLCRQTLSVREDS